MWEPKREEKRGKKEDRGEKMGVCALGSMCVTKQ